MYRDKKNRGYIEGLPPSLSPEEEARLLAQLGTESAAQAKNRLIERNQRLVLYIAKQFDNTGIDVSDLFSIGIIGLIKAVHTFRLDKNTKLATYAARCIKNEILMYLRWNAHTKSEVSIDEILSVDGEGNHWRILDTLSTDADTVYKNLEKELENDLLRLALQKLDRLGQTVITLRYGLTPDGEEKTQLEVAALLGVSQSYVSRLEKKSLKRLKKAISEMM
jgi:RNA polymerase sporulation-specific sigma factor